MTRDLCVNNNITVSVATGPFSVQIDQCHAKNPHDVEDIVPGAMDIAQGRATVCSTQPY